MTSGVSASGEPAQYYWCLLHKRVETEGDACAGQYRLGPYATAQDASRAVQMVAEREARLDAEDARWKGEKA
ncbi:hypothetical protein Lfu02_49030 [Longispora fulva]|uniref:SPOR domain-containing protein n=1 Tax=Longispora fulva TaxID=619741 RepID=A0A8J7GG20_9ACTN|nr:hypothetical protein [Longispora fulva]MBG6138279.1 hypothetical protein [Longispora fulva]GIG60531.1 hypothetical protein Lfu02_49030 [Longispora fulva]